MPILHTSDPLTNNIYADVDYIKKSMLGFDFTDIDDESLLIVAESASRSIDDYTSNIFFQQQVVAEKHKCIEDYNLRLFLRTDFKPITQISSIFLETIPSQTAQLNLDYVDVHHKQGHMYIYANHLISIGMGLNLQRFSQGTGYNIVINYTAGPETVPAPVKRACALLVRNMLRPGQLSSGIGLIDAYNTGSLKKVESKSYKEEYDTISTGAPSMKMTIASQDDFLFTSDVKSLLRPYIKVGIL